MKPEDFEAEEERYDSEVEIVEPMKSNRLRDSSSRKESADSSGTNQSGAAILKDPVFSDLDQTFSLKVN